MTRMRLFVFVGLMVCLVGSVGAYHTSTHAYLSRIAAAQSNLGVDFSSLLVDIGLGPYGTAQLTNGQTIESAIQQGAIEEDTYSRPLNHFFDPQCCGYAGRGLDFGLIWGYPAPTWALEDTGSISVVGNYREDQDYSYRDGQWLFYQALTAQSAEERKQKFTITFQILGHVIHLIQDMAQPQHTRNAAHTTLPWAWYENYTEEVKFPETTDGATAIENLISNNAYPVSPTDIAQILPTARSFFYTAGATVPKYIGMAEYSARNFVTFNNPYRLNNGVILPYSSEFPLPNGTNANGVPRTLAKQSFDIDGHHFDNVNVLVGNVYDELAAKTIPNRVLGKKTLVEDPRSLGGYRIFYTTQDPIIATANYDLLLPRAVAFSSAMINRFFRARLDLQRSSSDPTGRSWIIKNSSGEALAGTFSFYGENASLVRNPISGAVWNDMTINSGASVTVTLPSDPPAGTQKLILVFWGRVGTGDPAPTSPTGFATAAAKVVTYTPPLRPCQGPLSREGGQSGYETNSSNLMELGQTAGPVQVEFEAYGITDSLVIKKNSSNGTVLVPTTGLVSGFHPFTISHNPGPNEDTKLYVKVTGNPTNSNTWWTLSIGCPGQAIDNSIRVRDRVTVTFWYEGLNINSACAAGYYSYFLDGALVGSAGFGFGAPNTLPASMTTTMGPGHSFQITTTITRTGTTGCNYTGGPTHYWRISNSPGSHHAIPNGQTGGFIDLL